MGFNIDESNKELGILTASKMRSAVNATQQTEAILLTVSQAASGRPIVQPTDKDVVDKADSDLGTVTATKLAGYSARVTVTVRPKGNKQVAVRASIEHNDKTVDDPQTYQDFFSALSKSLFLSANQVD